MNLYSVQTSFLLPKKPDSVFNHGSGPKNHYHYPRVTLTIALGFVGLSSSCGNAISILML